MKKIVSLLAVALFATTFAAGCGKFTKCSEATKKEECEKADNFDKEKDDKGNCFWNEKAKDGKGGCEVKAGAPATPANTDAADKALCDAATKDEATCTAVKLANDKKACKWTAGTPNKCELKDK